MASNWSYAVFTTSSAAKTALDRLTDAGVTATDVEVRSSVPIHGIAPGGRAPKTRVPTMAILGGIVGGVGAFLLASLTALDYPLPTGGMPIVALPPSGIITFEGTAIGAILCTVATVFYEGELFRFRKAGPLDEHIAAGNIVVSVRSAAAPALQEWAVGAIVTQGASGD